MFTKYFFLCLLLFNSCSSRELTNEEIFGKERDKRIYSALRKFRNDMAAKGYRIAGIGEGLDHSTGKQNYLGVTFDTESLPDIDFAREMKCFRFQ